MLGRSEAYRLVGRSGERALFIHHRVGRENWGVDGFACLACTGFSDSCAGNRKSGRSNGSTLIASARALVRCGRRLGNPSRQRFEVRGRGGLAGRTGLGQQLGYARRRGTKAVVYSASYTAQSIPAQSESKWQTSLDFLASPRGNYHRYGDAIDCGSVATA